METKVCNRCKNEQDLCEYRKNKNTCKGCLKLDDERYRNKNSVQIKINAKIHRDNNKDKLNKSKKAWRENNPEKNEISYQKWLENNPTRLKEIARLSSKNYRKNNPDKVNKINGTYVKKRKSTDALFKLTINIRNAISNSFNNKGYTKKSRTYEIIGCSYEEFKQHLESLWEPWMNWDNYGNPKDGILEPNKTWDIDHIIPLASSTTEEMLLELNHYSNLQPLCSHYNRNIKKDNY